VKKLRMSENNIGPRMNTTRPTIQGATKTYAQNTSSRRRLPAAALGLVPAIALAATSRLLGDR
jgi:hypothetical protein